MKPLFHHNAVKVGFTLLLPCLVTSCRKQVSHTIAFVPQTTGTELWEAAHTSADRTAFALGRSIYWNAPTREDDVQGQLALLQQALRRPLLGLLVSPDNALALLGTLQKAEQRGLAVAVVQNDLPLAASSLRGFFINDEQATGEMIAVSVGRALGGHGSVAVLGNNRVSTSSFTRLMAIQQALQHRFPGIRILAVREGTSDIGGNQRIAAEMIATHPDLDALIAMNATAMEGALNAVRSHSDSKRPRLFGCGQELDVMEAVRLGQVDAVVAEDTYRMAALAVQFVVRTRADGPVEPKKRIRPLLVTRVNIDSAPVQLVLSPGWRSR